MDKFEYLFNLNKKVFNLYGKMLTIRRFPYLLKRKSVLRRNKEIIYKKKSDDCYIVGLGPSLKNVDLTKLQGDFIVTNRFYKVQDAQAIKPIAYVLCDNDFFNDKHVEDFKEAVNMFPTTNFVVNGMYYNTVADMYPSKNNFYFLFLWDGFINGNRRKKLDITKVLPMSSNVVCTALFVALYMGYRKIYLLGCDFSSFASPKMVHAYDEVDSKRIWTMSNELFQYSYAADMHVQLNNYSRKNDIEINNATQGSLIDAYNRVNVEDLYV